MQRITLWVKQQTENTALTSTTSFASFWVGGTSLDPCQLVKLRELVVQKHRVSLAATLALTRIATRDSSNSALRRAFSAFKASILTVVLS